MGTDPFCKLDLAATVDMLDGLAEVAHVPATGRSWDISCGGRPQIRRHRRHRGRYGAALSNSRHRSSCRPLKNGCRTLPSADFARYFQKQFARAFHDE
jgi:hypothetical protein